MISVIVPTNRIGGLDVLFGSLAAQTEKDFELILVDSIAKWRPRYPHDWSERPETFDYKQIEPRDNPFPWVAYCRTVNSGIAHARGETIVLLCDYSWLHPRCLETHAECQKKNPGPTHLDYNYSALPKLKEGFPGYHQGGFDPGSDPRRYDELLNETTDRYVADLESGRLDPFMWSLFEEPLTEESISALDVTHRHRPCATRKADDWNWCSFKNESFPTELFLELNGLDEAYDESHCYQDQETSYRLRERGIPWNNGPVETGMVTVVNPRPVLNVKKLRQPFGYNADLCFMHRKAENRLPVNPEFSLREWRERMAGK